MNPVKPFNPLRLHQRVKQEHPHHVQTAHVTGRRRTSQHHVLNTHSAMPDTIADGMKMIGISVAHQGLAL
jgi:hypothetical protein